MADAPENDSPPPVDPRWRQTLRDVPDLRASVHVRAPATVAATKETPGKNPVIVPANDAPPAAGGVSGNDFFAFRDVLGHGGMGTVHHAVQKSLARDVAVKMLRAEDLRDPDVAEAFLREAQTTGALVHPNIVPVHLCGRDEQGRPFMVMKQVRGQPWNLLLGVDASAAGGAFDLRRHLEIFLKVCDAVAFAHAHEIVHRDLKPSNIMVGEFGEVTVMDWGLALDVSPRGDRGLALPRAQASLLAGTPAYMAPEMVRCAAGELGPATDIYLLGGILFEIVSGRPPHVDADVMRLLRRVSAGELDPLQPRPGLEHAAAELERLIVRAMACEPARRYPDVAALQADVRAFLAGQGNLRESGALARQAQREMAALADEAENMLVTSAFYPRCSEVLDKLRRALALWPANPQAARARLEMLALFTDFAVREKDWGLAESMLRDLKFSGPEGRAFAEPLETRMRAERQRARLRGFFVQRALRLAALAAIFTTGLSAYLAWRVWSAPAPAPSHAPEVPDDAASETPPDEAEPVVQRMTLSLKPAKLKLLKTWQLAGENATSDLWKEGLRTRWLLCGPDDELFCFDDGGHTWSWRGDGATAGENPREVSLGFGAVTAASWTEAQGIVAAATADGKLNGLFLRADGGTEWESLANLKSPLRALAARSAIMLAGISDESVRFTYCDKDWEEQADSPLCVQVLPGGTALTAGARELRIWPPGKAEFRVALKETYAAAAAARDVPVFALIPDARKSEVQVLRLDLETRGYARAVVPATVFKAPPSVLALSNDGRFVAVGRSDGRAVLLGGDPLRVLAQAGEAPVALRAFAFDEKATRLYTLDARGKVSAWELPATE